MNLIIEAFQSLYPGKTLDKEVSITYSGKFKSYNANVRITPYSLGFNLSKEWRKVDKYILIGLIQSLLNKIYKTKNKTVNIDLYNLFIKNLDKSIPKTKYDPILAQSFQRNNEKYFYGNLNMPNLRWGQESNSKLGSYDYHTDMITISSIFLTTPRELLDYVMYHEMLHKKIKYTQTGSKSLHHSKEFKEKEKEFENSGQIERQLNILCSRRRIKTGLFNIYKRRIKGLFDF